MSRPATKADASTNNQDFKQLKRMSILQGAAGGLSALLSALPLFYVRTGLIMALSPANQDRRESVVWWFMVGLGGTIALLGLLLAICMMSAGWFMSRRKHYVFCLVVAGLSCVWFPIGTAVGIFTLGTLVRPAVRRSFLEPAAVILDATEVTSNE